MTRRWLKLGATICLIAGVAIGVRAVAESTLTVELPPSMLCENPFAAQPNSAPVAEPPAPEVPAVEPAVEVAQVEPIAMAPVVVEPVTQPVEPPTSPMADDTIASEVLPVFLLPTTEAPPSAEPELPLANAAELPVQFPALPAEIPVYTATAPPADILPVPVEPQSEMLDALELIWSDDAATATEAAPDAASNLPYTPTVAELSQQLLPSVRRAYGLAQRGALFAAQAEFVQVLQRIAQAKDAEAGTDEHSHALAAGLRALDEADDFMPEGVQLEADMNVGVIASSHRTPPPAGGQLATARESIGHYLAYSQEQLGQSVAGERAGSMALYGLGKVYNRLANESDGNLRQQRKAMTMYLAALKAGPENHLAANEVGVLLSRSGHPEPAAAMFRRAIDIAPTSTNYHNLAMVERKLGQYEQANANAQYAGQLAARDRAAGAMSRSKGVKWVAPQDLARASNSPQMPMAPPMDPMAANGPGTNSPTTRVMTPRGSSGTGQVKTVAGWPQKLIPSAFRR